MNGANGSADRLTLTLDRPASAEEAAAIAAALELFVRETTPIAPRARPAESHWARAARLDGLRGAGERPGPWGDGEPWGR